jgi:hypothetical protein
LHLWTAQAQPKFIERHWERWRERDSFNRIYGDGGSSLSEPVHLKNA